MTLQVNLTHMLHRDNAMLSYPVSLADQHPIVNTYWVIVLTSYSDSNYVFSEHVYED